MTKAPLKMKQRFRSVILCDDIRSEVGNKKSIMGVYTGDVVVAEFPARIRICLYLEFAIDPADAETLIDFKLLQDHDGKIIQMGEITTRSVPPGNTAYVIIPQGIGVFEKPCDFVLSATVKGKTLEILRKKVLLGELAPR